MSTAPWEEGGHSSAICEKLSADGLLIGIDRDRDALSAAEEGSALIRAAKNWYRATMAEIKQVLRELDIEAVDGAILDLGVSSFQLDNADRGFSYMQDSRWICAWIRMLPFPLMTLSTDMIRLS